MWLCLNLMWPCENLPRVRTICVDDLTWGHGATILCMQLSHSFDQYQYQAWENRWLTLVYYPPDPLALSYEYIKKWWWESVGCVQTPWGEVILWSSATIAKFITMPVLRFNFSVCDVHSGQWDCSAMWAFPASLSVESWSCSLLEWGRQHKQEVNWSGCKWMVLLQFSSLAVLFSLYLLFVPCPPSQDPSLMPIIIIFLSWDPSCSLYALSNPYAVHCITTGQGISFSSLFLVMDAYSSSWFSHIDYVFLLLTFPSLMFHDFPPLLSRMFYLVP